MFYILLFSFIIEVGFVYIDYMLFLLQPDMSEMQDEGITDEISRLEEKYRGQVFDSVAKALFTKSSITALFCGHFRHPIFLWLTWNNLPIGHLPTLISPV